MEADISKLENDKQILQTSKLQVLGETRLLDTVMAEKNQLIIENNQLQKVNKQLVSEIDCQRIELERQQKDNKSLQLEFMRLKAELESISALASNSKHKNFVSPVSEYFTKT